MNNADAREISILQRLSDRRLLAIVIILLALSLRAPTLDMRSLWFDEAIEFWVAGAPFGEIHETVSRLTHDPPLYSYLMRLWKQVGQQEFWLRLPSLFMSLLGLSALMRLGRLRLGWVGGLFAGLLVASSAADVRYAQEMGQYAFMTALLSLNLVFLFTTRRRSSPLIWILWGITAVLSIYIHYGAVLVICVTSFIWLLSAVRARDWVAVRRQLLAGAGAVLLLVPLLALVIPGQMARSAALPAPIVPRQFPVLSNAVLLFQFMGNPGPEWIWPAVPEYVVSAPLILVLLVALWKASSLTDWPVLLIAVWIGYYLLGMSGLYAFDGTRHSLLIAPLLMLTTAAGLVVSWRAYKPAGLLLLLYLVGLGLVAPPEGQEDLRSVTQFWSKERADDHATYVYFGAVPGFRYQLLPKDDIGATGDLPGDWYMRCWAGEPDPYCVQDNIYYGRWLRNLETPTKVTRIFETLGRRPDQFWIIFSHTGDEEIADLLSHLRQDYVVAREHRASHASAFLLERLTDTLSPGNLTTLASRPLPGHDI